MSNAALRRAPRPQPARAPAVPQRRVLPAQARPAPQEALLPDPPATALPARPAAQRSLAPRAAGWVASEGGGSSGLDPLAPAFLEDLHTLEVLAVEQPARLCPPHQPLAEARGYAREDLLAVAEVAYAYLFAGFPRLSLVLFEGLNAVAPSEPYYALALGLNHDLLGDLEQAEHWYKRASALDPTDGRPDINRAELMIERGRWAEAQRLLAQGLAKLGVDGDPVLREKARALLGRAPR